MKEKANHQATGDVDRPPAYNGSIVIMEFSEVDEGDSDNNPTDIGKWLAAARKKNVRGSGFDEYVL